MAKLKYLRDAEGTITYPVTHERAVRDSNGNTLEAKLANLASKSYVVAWDGSSAPTVSNIPAGVTVTYSSTSYTGTKAASSSTIGKVFLVKNGNNYDRYITSENGGAYSWVSLGSTEMDFSDYTPMSQFEVLDDKMNDIYDQTISRTDVVVGDYALRNYQIKADGTKKYATNDSYKHIVIPVSAGTKVTVQSRTSNGAQIAWLKNNNTPVSGGNAPLVDGTDVISVEENTSLTITAPTGATYLYVYRGSGSSYPWTPQSIKLIVTHIPTIIDSLEVSDANSGLSARQGVVLKEEIGRVEGEISKNNGVLQRGLVLYSEAAPTVVNNLKIISDSNYFTTGNENQSVKYVEVSTGDTVRIVATHSTGAAMYYGWSVNIPANEVYINDKTYVSSTTSVDRFIDIDYLSDTPLYFAAYSSGFDNISIKVYRRADWVAQTREDHSSTKLLLNYFNLTDISETLRATWNTGYFCDSRDGTTASASTLSYSQKISTRGKKYLLYTRNVSTGTGYAGLAFYDANGDFVSGQRQIINATEGALKPTVITIPDTATSFRSTVYTSMKDSWFCYLTDNENILNFGISGGGGEAGADNSGRFALKLLGISDFEAIDNEGWYEDKWINYSTGGRFSGEGLSSSYKKNTNGKKYLVFLQNITTGTGQAGLAFYDENDDYVSGVRQYTGADESGGKLTIVTIPEGATYFRATIWTSMTSEWFAYLTDDENIFKYDASATDGTIHLKIALFGNSYTADAWRYVPKMLLAYGITMESYFYYRGSGSLYDLDTQWTHDSATDIADIDGAQHTRLTFYVNSRKSPNWSTATRRSASDVLDMRQWDIISLQQGGNRCKNLDSYYPSLQNIIDKIELQAPYPKTLCWYMAYNGASENAQEGTSAASLTTQNTIIKRFPFNLVIPAASAVFDAQTNETLAALGDSSYHNMYASDDTHLQEGLPAYVGACAVVQAILNKYRPGMSVLGDTFRATAENIADLGMNATANGSSTGVTDANCYLAQKAAIVGNNSPFEIIEI